MYRHGEQAIRGLATGVQPKDPRVMSHVLVIDQDKRPLDPIIRLHLQAALVGEGGSVSTLSDCADSQTPSS